MQYVLAVDQGTTGSTVILFDRRGEIVERWYREINQSYPRPGWVEHDAREIFDGVRELVAHAVARYALSPDNLAAIGITNQRETVLLWDRETGEPLHPAVVWQCRRTADLCQKLRQDGVEPEIVEKTGLLLDPYFSGTKVKWLLDHAPQARTLAKKGRIACGTIDSWLVWNLTGGRVHATDVTNASRTLLFNIDKLEWDDDLLSLFDVPRGILPEVRPTAGDFGRTEGVPGIPDGIPIGACCGDQQSALFGQVCFTPGMVKNTYGTGAFILMNAGARRPKPEKGLLTTVAWAIKDLREPVYAVEGSVFVAGAVVQWLRDSLGLFEDAAETEAMAKAVPDNGGVYFVPAFVGLGAPRWDPYARGTIVGLTRGTQKEHLVRAALESIAFESREVMEAMAKGTGLPMETVRIDGGAAANDFLAQFQADLSATSVQRPQVTETTSLGAAYLAGLAVGLFSSRSDLESLWRLDATFRPSISSEEREALWAAWNRAVERSLGWEQAGREQTS